MPDSPADSRSMASKLAKSISHRDHVLLRPELHIGPTNKETALLGTVSGPGQRILFASHSHIPGLSTILDEILVNVCDHRIRIAGSPFPVKTLTVTYNDGVVTVKNDGNGIPVTKLESGKWNPSVCLGELLSSTNYDDSEERLGGGRNGVGSAVTNIWSQRFCLQTCWQDDQGDRWAFSQEWKDNMVHASTPKIKEKVKKGLGTTVSFLPDYERFGVTDEEWPFLESLLRRRLYDIAATTPLRVTFNGDRIDLSKIAGVKRMKNFAAYALLLGPSAEENPDIVHASLGERWECVVMMRPPGIDDQDPPSFVNGIRTDLGGEFVDVVCQPLFQRLAKHVKDKKKFRLTRRDHLSQIWVIVNALIDRPEFESQTKSKCTSTKQNFGSQPAWSKTDLDKAFKMTLPFMLAIAEAKNDAKLQKQMNTGKKSKVIVDKYESALWSGTRKSNRCSLFLCEGDSAKAMIMAGFSVIGRKQYGCFPLKGKMINVKKNSLRKNLANTEIANLVKILGLPYPSQGPAQQNVRESLRYHKVVIVCDQDPDGSHIKGLIINFFHTYYPELLTSPGFLNVFHTPIVVGKYRHEKRMFFTLHEFETFQQNAPPGWKFKWYKGLGTSNQKEAKEYFKRMDRHLKPFPHTEALATIDRCVNVAFSDDKAFKDLRKQMVCEPLDESGQLAISYEDFFAKELPVFWRDDNERSMASVIDGLKVSQRKILYSALEKGLWTEDKEVRVAQLSGFTSEFSQYHHGEASLNSAIVKMAQDYMGSNNINLLIPDGQFGTRLQNGSDAASERYINTYVNPICKTLFPESLYPVLDFLMEDGKRIEPAYFVPVIPFSLVNEARGIGTGMRSFIPSFNPNDVVAVVEALWDNRPVPEIAPWHRGFRGSTVREGDGVYRFEGVVERAKPNKAVVTELPPGRSTESYIEKLRKKGYNVQSLGTDTRVDIHVESDALVGKDDLLGLLDLKQTIKMNEMCMINPEKGFTVYETVGDIARAHYNVAMETYEKRRLYDIQTKQNLARAKREKAHYIQGFCGPAHSSADSRSGGACVDGGRRVRRCRHCQTAKSTDRTVVRRKHRQTEGGDPRVGDRDWPFATDPRQGLVESRHGRVQAVLAGLGYCGLDDIFVKK